MEIRTHKLINQQLCGTPTRVEEKYAEVEMRTTPTMAVDEKGLVHGGFIFGQADYAAMLAVNHPNVVLGAAEVRFLKPVKVGDFLIAVAKVEKEEDKRKFVSVFIKKDNEEILFWKNTSLNNLEYICH